jgi:hypothetical protein
MVSKTPLVVTIVVMGEAVGSHPVNDYETESRVWLRTHILAVPYLDSDLRLCGVSGKPCLQTHG